MGDMVTDTEHERSSCPFCAIVNEQQPAQVVWQSSDLVVFLDSRPLAVGHCLVVPRSHVETLLELPDQLAGPLLTMARRVAAAQESALGVDGSLVAVNVKVSQSVPHLHVHVVPRRRGDWLPLRLLLRRTVYRNADHRREVAELLADRLAATAREG